LGSITCSQEYKVGSKEYAIASKTPRYEFSFTYPVIRGAGPLEKNFSVFNITKDGLLITFTTYQVASYADGPQEVFIPYRELKDYLNPEGILKGF
jgi:hypothetical protein